MVKITTAKESTKGRHGVRALSLLDCEDIPGTRLAYLILQQTATELETFQKMFTFLRTADELIFVQNIDNKIQLVLMQVHKLLFGKSVAHSGDDYVLNMYGNELAKLRVLCKEDFFHHPL